MRAAIYTRVSTDKQGRDQTIDSQLDALRRWANVHGHELKNDHVYIDEGYSGARLDRPALDRLRDAAREGEFDVLGVYSPDRLARRYAYQILLLEEFRKAACAVEFIERPISDDPHDQLLLQIQGAIAEYERAVLAERFRRGKLQKARAGQWGAGRAPYGYRYVPKRDGVPGHLEVDEAEAEVVRMLYRWLIDERMTVRQILKRLAAGSTRPRNGKRLWSNSVVHRILSDSLYTGTAYANRHVFVVPRKPRSTGPRAGLPTCRKPRPCAEWVPIPVPAIIDEATHQHAIDQLARNSVLSFRNNTRHDYLLRCLLTCQTCGLAMFGITTSGAGGRRRYRYYTCHGKDTVARDRECRCPQSRTKVEELDTAVWGHVKTLLNDPVTLAAQFEERAKQADALDADAHAAGQKWEAQLRRLDREEQRLLDAYQAEAIDLDELRQRREQIRGRRQVLTTQRAQEQRLRCERQTAKEVWADLTAFCERVRARLDDATLAERQRILQLLIDRVIVGEDTLEIRHVIPLGRLKAEPASPGPTDPAGSGGGEGSEPEGTPPLGLGARLRSDGVEDAQLMVRIGPKFGEHARVEVRAVGDHDRGVQTPVLEVLEVSPHGVLVVLVDQREGHGQVGERVGGQEQREATQVQFVDAKRAAEEFQDLAPVRGHVELPGVVVEHVVDEPRGEFEEELAAERLQGPLDAHAVLEDAVEHEVTDLVVGERPGEDPLGGVAEGLAAMAPGAVLATGDLEVGDGLEGDGADPTRERPLSAPMLTALRARGLLGGTTNRYNDGCGCSGTHACVRGEEAVFANLDHKDASPIFQEQNGLRQAHPRCVRREVSEFQANLVDDARQTKFDGGLGRSFRTTAGGRTMHELTITPEGHLLVRETSLATSDRKPSKRLLEAYTESPARGMFFSATEEMDAALPPPFEFARSIARLYLTNLCHAAIAEPGGAVTELPPPPADLERAVLQAPPMTGLEYLSEQVLANWWRDLDALAHSEIKRHPGGTQGYLRERNPQWRYVGRVTLHLAENKRNPDYPFAFLATFANGLTPQGKVKHEPLGRALQQYAGEQNREAMLTLLLPISRAAESSELIRRLVDSAEIYHPLAWSPREAYEFLKAIPLFESSGLIVRVPDWWNAQKPARPRVSVKIDTKNSAGIGVDSLLEFSVGVSLEGETLGPDEIAQLLESSGGLIPLKGKWVEVDREKLNEALTHWKRVEKDVRREGISFFQGMRLLSGANLAKEQEEGSEASIREWTGLTAGAELDSVLKGLRAPETRLEKAPPELKAELRPYQQTGYSWLRFVARLGLGACLADDMGLGKTVQVISLLLELKREQSKKKAASLLVVPASLIANWKSELGKFAPSLSYAVVHPSEVNAKGSEVGLADVDVFDLIVTTYGMLVRTDWMKRYRWRLVILDEAQAIKNSGTKQTRAVKELTAGTRIAMTGTPVENRLSDLWSLFDFLNPGLLGTAKQFSSFVKKLQDASVPSFEPLRNLVRPYILRRLKTDKRVIADLPDKTEVKAFCSLSKHQAALYQKAVEELAEQLDATDGIQRRGIVLTQLMRLKQICNHPAQVTGTNDYAADRSGKFRRLAEIAEEIASRQEKVLVFTQFREITEPLAGFLATLFGRPGLVLHGGTSVPKRKEYVDRFQREDGPPFFVLSLKAGGTGLNLTSASHVIHFDRWWNPAIENQATDRAFRIGQKKNVLVHKFICLGTVEERIDEMIMRKTQVADEAIGGNESGEVLLTEMDDDTLLQFVKLDLHQAIDA